jgi:hypothetical protein
MCFPESIENKTYLMHLLVILEWHTAPNLSRRQRINCLPSAAAHPAVPTEALASLVSQNILWLLSIHPPETTPLHRPGS